MPLLRLVITAIFVSVKGGFLYLAGVLAIVAISTLILATFTLLPCFTIPDNLYDTVLGTIFILDCFSYTSMVLAFNLTDGSIDLPNPAPNFAWTIVRSVSLTFAIMAACAICIAGMGQLLSISRGSRIAVMRCLSADMKSSRYRSWRCMSIQCGEANISANVSSFETQVHFAISSMLMKTPCLDLTPRH